MGLNDVDILREMVVQREDEFFQGMLGRGEEIDHLTLGMGPGIGAAGAPDPNRLARKLGQSLFQLPLNRRLADLELEPGVSGPLIFNQKGGPPKLPAL
jgi:hypothetical protein